MHNESTKELPHSRKNEVYYFSLMNAEYSAVELNLFLHALKFQLASIITTALGNSQRIGLSAHTFIESNGFIS